MHADVVVVGAGLAGLRCAQALTEAGRDVVVLEADDVVGGRIRTDRIDGFLVDRGFQLLNPAYPAVRRWVDVDALGLQPFGAGVAARTETGLAVLGHPLREPAPPPADPARGRTSPPGGRGTRTLGGTAAAGRAAGPRSRRCSARAPTWTGVRPWTPQASTACCAGWSTASSPASCSRTTAAPPTASRKLLTWMFATGVPALPRTGMSALPAQLAATLGDRVHLGERVHAVTGTSVGTDAGTWTADHVVVATGAAAAAGLTSAPATPTKGVVTMWWAAPDAPDTDLLHVDARRTPTGPLVNAAVVSRAAPSYAPPGRHLVEGSALMGSGRDTDEASMRRHAGDLLGADTRAWEVVVRHEVPDALPVQPAPYVSRQPIRVGDVVVCGDHRDTGSIQGALASGQRAAEAIL